MAIRTREQVVGRVSHLVKQRVDALRSIPREEKIHVEGNLDDVAMAVAMPPWHHVSKGGSHAVAKAQRDVVGQHAVETRGIEVAVERPQVLALVVVPTAVLDQGATTPVIGSPSLLECTRKLGPFEHDITRSPRSRRRYAASFDDDRESFQDIGRRRSIGHMQIQCGPSLRERPHRGTVLAKGHTVQFFRATTPQSGSKRLGSMELRHTSKKRKKGLIARPQYVVVSGSEDPISRARHNCAIAHERDYTIDNNR